MAQQAQHSFCYQNFTILKDQTLGHGSYGAVYKARCDQLMCAAKILHPTIVDSFDPGSERILQRFRQECDFLNQIRHPHIVQYLGVCRDPDSNLPALLMELLDCSLTKMLESSPHPISYHIQVDLCHHIALAIAYLHSNGIIHRDLSGNNVLVIAGRRAKVTDFGMSRIVGTERHFTPLTLCPGTLGYMSPESLKEPPRYTEKLHVFSQGVIMIQVCTQEFPDPGTPVKEVEDSRFPLGMVQLLVPETERRKKHIDLIDPTHPLLPIALTCLEYRERDRPSSEELCQRLADLKENHEYIESSQNTIPSTPEMSGTLQQERDELARRVEENSRELVAKDQQIAVKDQLIAAKDQDLVRMSRQLAVRDREIERLGIQLQELNQRLVDEEQATAQFQETNQQLQQQIQDLQMQVKTHQEQLKMESEPPKDIVLQWRDGGKAPFTDVRGSSVVVGNVAYFPSGSKMYSYKLSSRRWNNVPDCPQVRGSLAVVNSLLTMVGGEQKSDGKTTSKLVSLKNRGKWVEQFPPMPTPRCGTTATTYQNHLIVAGGLSVSRVDMDTVEVLNIDTLVWSTAAGLPRPFAYGSATIASGRLYMLGAGNNSISKHACQSVFSCSLPDLLQSGQTHSVSAASNVWQCDADIPVLQSTCATIHGQLIAIGGIEDHGVLHEITKAVYKYNPNTRSWTVISHMATARHSCYIVVTETTNELMVVGGSIGRLCSDSVEIASCILFLGRIH